MSAFLPKIVLIGRSLPVDTSLGAIMSTKPPALFLVLKVSCLTWQWTDVSILSSQRVLREMVLYKQYVWDLPPSRASRNVNDANSSGAIVADIMSSTPDPSTLMAFQIKLDDYFGPTRKLCFNFFLQLLERHQSITYSNVNFFVVSFCAR